MKIYCTALISYFLVHNESIWKSLPRVYTQKCREWNVLHSCITMCTVWRNGKLSFSWALGFLELCCLKVKGSPGFIALRISHPALVFLLVESWMLFWWLLPEMAVLQAETGTDTNPQSRWCQRNLTCQKRDFWHLRLWSNLHWSYQ